MRVPPLHRPSGASRHHAACFLQTTAMTRALREQAARAVPLAVIPNNPTRDNPDTFEESRYGARISVEHMF